MYKHAKEDHKAYDIFLILVCYLNLAVATNRY